MTDDETTIAQVLGGARDEYRALVDRHAAIVAGFVGGMIRDRQRAEDLVQEAFVRAFVALDRFDAARGTFRSWLLTIARRVCLDELRRRSTPVVLVDAAPLIDDRSPVDAAASHEAGRRLDAALEGLPLSQRVPFVLFELQGLSYAEIAHVEGVALGTVKSRIGRARAALRAALEGVLEPLDER